MWRVTCLKVHRDFDCFAIVSPATFLSQIKILAGLEENQEPREEHASSGSVLLSIYVCIYHSFIIYTILNCLFQILHTDWSEGDD